VPYYWWSLLKVHIEVWCKMYIVTGIKYRCNVRSKQFICSSTVFVSPQGAGNFCLHHRVQTASGAHTASCTMGNGFCYPSVKAARAWSRLFSPLASAKVRHAWKYTSTHPIRLMAWCFVKHKESFTKAFNLDCPKRSFIRICRAVL